MIIVLLILKQFYWIKMLHRSSAIAFCITSAVWGERKKKEEKHITALLIVFWSYFNDSSEKNISVCFCKSSTATPGPGETGLSGLRTNSRLSCPKKKKKGWITDGASRQNQHRLHLCSGDNLWGSALPSSPCSLFYQARHLCPFYLREAEGWWRDVGVLYRCGCFAVDTGLSWVTPARVLLGLGLWRKRTVQVCSYLERHFQAWNNSHALCSHRRWLSPNILSLASSLIDFPRMI